MKLDEKTIEKKYIYKGRIINVRTDTAELPNGKQALREVVEHPGGVTVAALTDNDELMFVRQFRYPYSEVLLELPAGKLEYGEDPFEAGKRELREETGAVGGRMISLGALYPSVAICDEIIHLCVAEGFTMDHTDPDDDEFLRTRAIPLDELVDMVMRGEVPDAKTQIAVLKTARLRDAGVL